MSNGSPTGSIARAALVVSILSAAFSFLQWSNTESENRISVAVEISKNYLKERDVAASGLVVKTVNSGLDSISKEEAIEIGRYTDLLSYIALLTNKNRLDKAYLADTIACDIFYANKAIGILKKYFGEQDREMLIFIKQNPCLTEIAPRPQSN
jgi:hypothetical protein